MTKKSNKRALIISSSLIIIGTGLTELYYTLKHKFILMSQGHKFSDPVFVVVRSEGLTRAVLFLLLICVSRRRGAAGRARHRSPASACAETALQQLDYIGADGTPYRRIRYQVLSGSRNDVNKRYIHTRIGLKVCNRLLLEMRLVLRLYQARVAASLGLRKPW